MTQSFPDSISAWELQNILDAKADDALADSLGLTEEPDFEECVAALNAMPSNFQNLKTAKQLAMILISRLHDWHTQMTAKRFEEGSPTSLPWAMDERTLFTTFQLLQSVVVDD